MAITREVLQLKLEGLDYAAIATAEEKKQLTMPSLRAISFAASEAIVRKRQLDYSYNDNFSAARHIATDKQTVIERWGRLGLTRKQRDRIFAASLYAHLHPYTYRR
jgi:hypothetical protein